MLYQSLRETVKSKSVLIPYNDDIKKYIKSNKDYYVSLYQYNDNHKKIVDETGSVAGIKDTSTDRVYLDFDSKDDLEKARKDTLTAASRICELNVEPDNIKAAFSGKKGFCLEFKLKERINPEQFKKLVTKLAGDLETFDTTVSDPNRIVRVDNTVHPETNLYKTPLELYELDEKTIPEILEMSKKPKNNYKVLNPVSIPEDLIKIEDKKNKTEVKDLDLSNVPRGWKQYKWALAQGYFDSGERHNALMVIAATCRGLGYDKETTYYMCKSALKKQAARTGHDEFSKEELWNNIIEQSVFSDSWQGGQFSPQNNLWLKQYCEKMGFKVDYETPDVVTVDETFSFFKNYAENIESLTVKSGIPALDKKLRMTVGMTVGLVAAPSVGKTSIAIQMLNNMSKQGNRSLFFSYDMYHAMVLQKLIQKHFNLGAEDIFNKFKTGDKKFETLVKEKLKQEYSKVDFCFKGGQNVEDILESIKATEDKHGEKVKFIVVDYNELILTDYSDSTQSSNYVAQKLREFANTQQICVLSLFQPNKMAGSPSDELLSYRSAKGGSAIEQSVSVMLGMSRPGFNPRNPENDIFTSINCLKNRMGPTFSLDLHWDGLTGSVRDLDQEEYQLLKKLREDKQNEKLNDGWA
jgi:hypothetical protein